MVALGDADGGGDVAGHDDAVKGIRVSLWS